MAEALDRGRESFERQERGVVAGEPGLYFVGLHFLSAMTSSVITGVGRDAEHIAEHIASRGPSGGRPLVPEPARGAP